MPSDIVLAPPPADSAAADREAPAGPLSRSKSPSRRRVGVAIFLAVFALVALTAGGHTSSSDEETMLATTRALVHGGISVQTNADNQGLLALRRTDRGSVGVYGLGESIAMIPTYLVGGVVADVFPSSDRELIERLFADFTDAWIAGLLAVVIFLLALELGASTRWSVVLALASIVATPLWVESKTMFSEPLTALFVTTAILFAVRAVRGGRPVFAFLSGLALGGSALARSTSALFAIPLALYVLAMAWRTRRQFNPYRIVGAFAAGSVLSLGLFLVSNWWRFGSPFDNGYPPQHFDTPLLTGLYGLFFSSGKSLFLYAPIAILAVAAIPLALRRRAAETLMLVGVFVVTIPVYATFHDWHGDFAWGPRYLYSTLPILLVIIAPALAGIAWRRALIVLACAGVIVNLSAVLVSFDQYIQWRIDRVGYVADRTWIDNFFHDLHFHPQWSPLIGQWRIVPEATQRSVQELTGQSNAVPPFPQGTSKRYSWYFKPLQLDLWWYKVVPTGLPLALELLVPCFFVIGAVGVRGLMPALRPAER